MEQIMLASSQIAASKQLEALKGLANTPRRVRRAAPLQQATTSHSKVAMSASLSTNPLERPSKMTEMNRRGFGLSLTHLAACPACMALAEGKEAKADTGPGGPKWDYAKGTTDWGDVAPICATGTLQSPIDIPLRRLARKALQGGPNGHTPKRKLIDMDYSSAAKGVSVVNTGPTLQVNIPAGSGAQLGGQSHQLLQYHFHTPSEHAFDTEYTAMEIHLVHKNLQDGSLSVFGVLMEGNDRAEPLEALDIALRHASASAGSSKTINSPVDLQGMLSVLLPDRSELAIVKYPGSLTTPPCAEGVEFYLSTEIVGVPPPQVDAFEHFTDDTGKSTRLGNNARPVQRINDRRMDLL